MKLLLIFTSFFLLTPPGCQKEGISCKTEICRGPYLQLAGENSIEINWRTSETKIGVVKYGTSLADLSYVATDSIPTRNHKIKLTGLSPGIKYYYSIPDSPEEYNSEDASFFTTAPTKGTGSSRIWVIGDAGSGRLMQNKVRNEYVKYSAGLKTDLWIWLGDNAYHNGKDSEYQSRVFKGHYEDLMKYIPVFAVPGNHDYANCGYLTPEAKSDEHPFYKIFSFPENGELGGLPSHSCRYYSIDRSNIHFVFLDTYGAENKPGSKLYQWLEKDLGQNIQKWTIVAFHHPPYTKGSHDSDFEQELVAVRQNLVPLFEKHKVDLVLSGHSHVYERSYPIRGHYGTSESFSKNMIVQKGSGKMPDVYKSDTTGHAGVIYMVVGSSGKLDKRPKAGWPHPAMYYSYNKKGGSAVLEVNENFLTSKFIDTQGEIKDEFSIVK